MLKKLGLAVAIGSFATAAMAEPFFINIGKDGGSAPDGDSITADINELGYSGTLATSFYFGDPSVNGTPVVDTNILPVFGFTPGAKTSINGTPVNLKNVTSIAERNIDSLNPLATGIDDTEGFGLGISNGWTLTYSYTLQGQVNLAAGGVEFTSGFFDVFYQDLNAAGGLNGAEIQVAKILVTGSDVQAANLNIFGEVDYSWCAPACGAFVENFFNDSASGESFYNIWSSSVPPPTINFVLDTNVNPPLPTASQLVQIPGGPLVRQTTLDGSVTFAVPEPGTLALLGAGLFGAGALRRRNKAAS